ncbi:MAG: DUF1360 domain-containing protein [Patescibacteria group bacterium]
MDNNLAPDRHVWNALFFSAFPIAVVLLYGVLNRGTGMDQLMGLTVLDLLILGLATFRLIRLVTLDKIFSFFRAAFMNTLPDGSEIRPDKGFRRAAAELIECLWCTGVWAALMATGLYVSLPIGRFFVVVLAISALGSFMQVVSKRVGAAAPHTHQPGVCS